MKYLTFFLLACSPAGTPPPYSKLPPLPPYLEAAAGRIPIGKSAILVSKHGSFGESDYVRRLIVVDAGLSLNTAWLTVEHERVHFIFFDAGLHMSDSLEERVSDVIAQARVAEMLR